MAGSLTLGGMAYGGSSGGLRYGPSTVSGSRIIEEVLEVVLEANVDYTVKIPSEAKQWAAFFGVGSSAPEVKVGSNLVATANGMPLAAQGFASAPIISGMTELKFKSASPPSSFQLCFI